MNGKQKFIIAMVILICVTIVLMISFVSLALTDRVLTSEGHQTVTQIITALIAIVSVVVGQNTKS